MRRREALYGMALASLSAGSAGAAEGGPKTVGWISYTDYVEIDLISDTLAACGKLGWVRGGNLHVDRRVAVTAATIQPYVDELVAARPELIVASGEAAALAISAVVRAPPILFYDAVDPVASGLVRSLARPNTAATGFVGHPLSLGPRWVQLLQEIVPGLRRLGVVFEPAIASSALFLHAISDFAKNQAIEIAAIPATDRDRAESRLRALVGPTPAAVIFVPDQVVQRVWRRLTQIARQARLPTMSWQRAFVSRDGLIAYGPDRTVLPGQLAAVINGILRGAKPADIPVQEPVRYELAINRLIAEELGLTIPPLLLAQADLVVE